MRCRPTPYAWALLPLVAALLVSAGESRAQQGVYSFTTTQPQTLGPWTNSFSLPQFDPSLGSLESAHVQVTYDITVSGSVLNTGSTPEDFTFAYESLLPVTFRQRLGSLLPEPVTRESDYTLGPGESASYGPYSASDTKWIDFQGTALTPFIGTGEVVLSAQTLSWPCVHGGDGKIEASLTVQSDATFTVEYFDTPVPEPSSAALLLLALGLVRFPSGRRRSTK